jgi:hypothetical protein
MTLIDEEIKSIIESLPKPPLEFIGNNLDKPKNELTAYMVGYFQGIKFVIETIEPCIKRMDEILNKHR